MIRRIKEQFPGIGCAWMNAAGEEAAEYYGFADRENNIAVDDGTIFPACSISKFVTAICVMKLHEKQVIDTDRPVNDYLCRWKLLTPEGKESDAAVRALLCHTAGIQDGEEGFCGLRRGGPGISLIDILEGRTPYDDNGLPIPGRFPPVPDQAASGLWSTPAELLIIAKAFVKALHGESTFLRAESAREMARPAKDFPWTGLGVFMGEEDILFSQGWGENGQCIMKMNTRTKRIAAVMTNRNPGVDQAESGVERLADSKLNEKE